jgi:energy-coupling factor transporter ATP-binding protein EcfA2
MITFTYAPISLIKFSKRDKFSFVLNEYALTCISNIGDGPHHTCVVAVSGPNGSGKTTFVNALVRSLLPNCQTFVPFVANADHDSVTDGIDIFDGLLQIRDPNNPESVLNIIVLDMQGSGIDVNGVLAEITRLNILASIVSTVVLHFTRGSSIQHSDIQGWAKGLFLLKSVKTALNTKVAAPTQLAEPVIVVRTLAVNLANADAEVLHYILFLRTARIAC